ncbi:MULTISPECIES: RICIN domain-containing protein [Streptomyces]|uniref:Ricin B lectin domain-containing protein n=1 Tax=Streptomyces luteosporeus TaxID=173856 RepID=A0ABN3TNT4_9ACTN
MRRRVTRRLISGRTVIAVLCGPALAVATATAAVASPGSTSSAAVGGTKIRSEYRMLFADVEQASFQDGARVIQYPADDSLPNQRFDFMGHADGTYEIVARHSGKCLDVYDASQADGAGVIQWPCNGDGNQRWRLEGVGGGAYQLRVMHSGKCLEASWSGTPGEQLRQYPCNGAVNQHWTLWS